jgi:hypothetical protein
MKIQDKQWDFQDDGAMTSFVHMKTDCSAMCFLCHDLVSAIKLYKLHHHHSYIHSDSSDKFPFKSKKWYEKLQALKEDTYDEEKSLFNALNRNELTIRAS